MDSLLALKPILTALALPAASALLFVIAMLLWVWHMPRSIQHFEAAGLTVLPAPMGYVRSDARPLLQWLPSATGLRDSTWVLREWLGLWVNRLH